MRHRGRAILQMVIVLLTVAACSPAGDPLNGKLTSASLGAGLTVSIPTSWSITPFGQPLPVDSTMSRCTEREASMGSSNGVVVRLWLSAQACDLGHAQRSPSNGSHGAYLSIHDVPDATNVIKTVVTAGTLTTFVQPYVECTNDCRHFTDHVALLALSHPPDPGRPTVMLVSDSQSLTTDDLAILAGTVTVGS